MSSPIRCRAEFSGALEHILLDRPKANILDLEMLTALRGHLEELSGRASLKAVVFEGSGAHFSFGASVAEHLPGRIGSMLPAFHGLFGTLERLGVPTAAVVRGQCLGGAMELAAWCGMVFCDRTARFAVPETRLGVFPPMAALALPWRIGGARSTRLILTGQTLDGETAASWGLADQCGDDPAGELRRWFEENLEPKSSVALRTAWRASRRLLGDVLKNDLRALEDLYLKDLMTHRDPVEGITAFVERREPVWSDS